MKKLFLLLFVSCAWLFVQAQDGSSWDRDYDSAQYVVKQYVFASYDLNYDPPINIHQVEINVKGTLIFSGDYLNIYIGKNTLRYVVLSMADYKEKVFDKDGDEYEWLQYNIINEQGDVGLLTVHNYKEIIDTYFFLIFDNIQHCYFTHLEMYHKNENKPNKEEIPIIRSGIRAMVY